MCALCGVLGGDDHWTDPVARPGVFVRSATPADRRRERARRISEANTILALFGMGIDDWLGSSYLLRTATGRTELLDSLAALWPAAEKLAGRPCDPLAPDVVARRAAANG